MPSQLPPQPARSPSPPRTAPPISSAPGERAQRLQEVFDSALKHTLKPCNYDNFAACFPTPALYEPDALKDFHRNFVGRMEGMCRTEFAALMDERDVVSSLNQLDTLVADAAKRRANATDEERGAPPTPAHLLPPSQILTAHLAPFIAEQSATLTTQLEHTQQSNVTLAEEITNQRQEIDALVRGLETAVADLEGAAAVLGEGEMMVGVEGDLEAFAASGLVK